MYEQDNSNQSGSGCDIFVWHPYINIDFDRGIDNQSKNGFATFNFDIKLSRIKVGQKMQNIKAILLVLCVAHVALTTAQADEDKLDPYIKVGIGMMSCEKFKNDSVYTGKRPRAAGVFSLGVVRNISQSLGIGLDFYYTEIDYRGSSIKQHNTIAGTSATGYYDVGTYKTITPYLAVGAGLARKNSGALVDTSNSARKIYIGTRKTEFTWNVGAGIKFDIDANYILDLGYRFAHLGNLKVRNAVQDNGNTFRGTTQKILGHQGMFSILYKF